MTEVGWKWRWNRDSMLMLYIGISSFSADIL